eukprot:GHVS01088145.1.p1 GENE.GHVS01088145.1~~GHVS01088145.1.p1  ORF type:complete len:306 (+),score=48.19 GHVS01088145.1:41-919(+)
MEPLHGASNPAVTTITSEVHPPPSAVVNEASTLTNGTIGTTTDRSNEGGTFSWLRSWFSSDQPATGWVRRIVDGGRWWMGRQSSRGGPEGGSSLAMLTGCTACTALITGRDIVVANAGDSRAVLCRGGRAVALSRDHKPQLRDERVRIYAAGGYLEMGRVNGNLNLSRAIGDLLYKSYPSLPAECQIVTAYPEIMSTSVQPDTDEFMVIGCDGIWEFLSSQAVIDFVRQRIASCNNLSDILEELFDDILSPNPTLFEYGCDNMSAIIVDLQPNKKHNSTNNTHTTQAPTPSS